MTLLRYNPRQDGNATELITCGTCRKKLPVSDFHRDQGRSTGCSSRCKECAKVYQLEYSRRPCRKASLKRYRQSPAGKKVATKAVLKYMRNNQQATRASKNVRDAVGKGTLAKDPCWVCGTNEEVHGHHEDYSKPLDVFWLCRKHHAERHRIMREEAA